VVESGDRTIPFFFELAVAVTGISSDDYPTTNIAFGVNQSVTYSPPRPSVQIEHAGGKTENYSNISRAFGRFGHDVAVLCNLTCPNPGFQDAGKQEFDTEPFTEVIEDVVGKAVRKLETDIRPRLNATLEDPDPEPDPSLVGKADKGFIKEYVFDHFWDVYNDATDGGRFDLEMRQFYYAMREPLMAEAARRGYEYAWTASVDNPTPFKLTDDTFRNHVQTFEEENIGHRIIERDDRGFFVEPHTGKRIRLGTAAVNQYRPEKRIDQYSALLFIEKTGFIGIIRETEIAKKYDIGVVNAKGYSTLAARDLVENIQAAARDADREIPMYALTDLDIAGLGIASDAKKTDDLSPIDTLDVERIGITLDDVEEYDLAAEPAGYSASVAGQLENNHDDGTVSTDVYEFLIGDGGEHDGGQRVEINALSPVEFAEYLETAFDELGIDKVEPESADDVDTPDVNNPEDARDDTIEQAVGDYVIDQLWDERKVEDLRERLLTDETPDADDIADKLEDEDIPVPTPDDSDDSEGDEDETADIAADIEDQIRDELDTHPPDHWEDINDDLVGDIEQTASDIIGEYEAAVEDAVDRWLDEDADLTVELHEKGDTDGIEADD
jgi:hypothetical protein